MATGDPFGLYQSMTNAQTSTSTDFSQIMNHQFAGTSQLAQQLGSNGIVQQFISYDPYHSPQATYKQQMSNPKGEPTCDYHLGACSVVHPLKKKLSRAIEKLRAEISAWHGDVLQRCPA